jgi:hypothetical protein
MLQPIDFSYADCQKEALELQSFLGGNQTLKERKEILPFFKARMHLSAFMGVYNYHIVRYDRVAHEYPFFGDFVCDLVVGDWGRRGYVFVEFEDAAPDSIFVKKKRETPEWSPRFEHGFSQILDWFYKLDTQRHAPDFEQRFGDRVVHLSGLLIVGRKEDFGPRERDRLTWRQQHVEINGNKIHCMTFDDLCENMLLRLQTFPALRQELRGDDEARLTESATVVKDPPDTEPPRAGM